MFGMSSWILQCSHPVLILNIAIFAVFFDFNKIVVTLCGPDEPHFRFDGTLSKFTDNLASTTPLCKELICQGLLVGGIITSSMESWLSIHYIL